MPNQSNRRIEAAGAVTIIFGVLTAVLTAGWAVVAIVIQRSGQDLPMMDLALLLVVGTGFVLLGWGVLRRKRACAALAGALAATLLTLQALVAMMTQGESISLYFLVLPAFVLAGNWVAWREMGELGEERATPLANRPGEPDRVR